MKVCGCSGSADVLDAPSGSATTGAVVVMLTSIIIATTAVRSSIDDDSTGLLRAVMEVFGNDSGRDTGTTTRRRMAACKLYSCTHSQLVHSRQEDSAGGQANALSPLAAERRLAFSTMLPSC